MKVRYFMKSVLGAVAALVFVAVTVQSASATVLNRSVPGVELWDHVFFNHSGGDLIIDILARDFNGGPNEGIHDSLIILFEDDGSPIGALTGAFVALDDDVESCQRVDWRVCYSSNAYRTSCQIERCDKFR